MTRMRLQIAITALLTIVSIVKCSGNEETIESGSIDGNELGERNEKLFNVFTIVRFKNDPCAGSSNRNGTCYTESECSNKGGTNAGSCAQGFGVCCVFVQGCGASVAENCTYFESSGTQAGQCSLEVCPCSSGICQMRLDFITFMITGPSTSTTTIKGTTAGVITPGAGIEYTRQTQCLTDTFTVTGPRTGQNTPPTICGVNTMEHMYADMEDDQCNTLDFQLGGAGIDAQIPGNRQWNIKITQIECNSELRAPQGCTQYFYGSNSQEVQSYNFDNGNGLHLANQNQNVCVRRERGNCKICWYAKDLKDVDTNGDNANAVGKIGAGADGTQECCTYKADGMGTNGYDCLQIPGAQSGTMCAQWGTDSAINANRFCGNSGGLAKQKDAAAAANTATVCTKSDPFSLSFLTDQFEAKVESAADTLANAQAGSGFRLTYFMSSNNC